MNALAPVRRSWQKIVGEEPLVAPMWMESLLGSHVRADTAEFVVRDAMGCESPVAAERSHTEMTSVMSLEEARRGTWELQAMCVEGDGGAADESSGQREAEGTGECV